MDLVLIGRGLAVVWSWFGRRLIAVVPVVHLDISTNDDQTTFEFKKKTMNCLCKYEAQSDSVVVWVLVVKKVVHGAVPHILHR